MGKEAKWEKKGSLEAIVYCVSASLRDKIMPDVSVKKQQ